MWVNLSCEWNLNIISRCEAFNLIGNWTLKVEKADYLNYLVIEKRKLKLH